ncbi:MAG: sulfatase-like hydrolase/transferase [Planctomycetes bacterium]|nr:sulfatase-like hydrolase/transferase [Planctomycetota bacterium]
MSQRSMLCQAFAVVAVASAFAAPAAAQAAPQASPQPPARRPDIVVILAADMGFSDIGCHGSEIPTPNIDLLAARGLRFTQFYNTARCCPTRASLLTGLYPHQAGVGHMVEDRGKPAYQGYLNDRCVTIAEVLGPAGYRTGMSGKWHVGERRPHWPTDRGFERYFGLVSGGTNYFKLDEGRVMARGGDLWSPPEQGFYITDAITGAAVSFLEEACARPEPFFLYVAYTAPHWPLHAPEEDIAKHRGKYRIGWDELRRRRHARQVELGIVDPRWPISPRDPEAPAWETLDEAARDAWDLKMAVYAAQVARMDAGVGRIVARLRDSGRLDGALVLFLSDNGGCAEVVDRGVKGAPAGTRESFLSYRLPWANASNTPFRSFKHWVHEGGIATPLIAHWPAGIKGPGSLTGEPGHVIDILPTCLEAAGAAYPRSFGGREVLPVEGKSLLPVLREGRRDGHEAIFWEHEGNRAVRRGKWKLVARHNRPWELYDLEADRTELHDLAGERAELARELSGLRDRWAARAGVLPWRDVREARQDARTGETRAGEARTGDARAGETNAGKAKSRDEKKGGAGPASPRPSILLAIADDWSWPHAGSGGDRAACTPAFDRVAREGVLFRAAFCAAPSCTPSRASLLTGQAPHRLAEGGNLWSFLPPRFATYVDLLEKEGYAVGHAGKGWGPGDFKAGGRSRNPAGPGFKSFEEFLKTVPAGMPFCFWHGGRDPHRPYERGSGAAAGKRPEDVEVPPWLPDVPEVRSDLLDYRFEVERFDCEVAGLLRVLEASGRAEDTIVAVTSDNGMPFPRAKANLYDAGTRVPLAVRWPARVRGELAGRVLDDLAVLTDLAPTFLEAAGLEAPADMTGRSLLGLVLGKPEPGAPARDAVFLERERHANVRKGDLSYPARAVRTRDHLYVRNLRPGRWPAGDPEPWKAVGPFGDVDGSPSKDLILERRAEPAIARFFRLAFERRPAEELYDIAKDPGCLVNLAASAEGAAAKERLRSRLERWMGETGDPRAAEGPEAAGGEGQPGALAPWDSYPYFGSGL